MSAPDSGLMLSRSLSIWLYRVKGKGRIKKSILASQHGAVLKIAPVPIHIKGKRLSYCMSIARIILKGQMSGCKIRRVNPQSSSTEGSPFFSVLLNLICSIPENKHSLIPAFSQKRDIWSGQHQLFPVFSCPDMYHKRCDLINRRGINPALFQLCRNFLRHRCNPLHGFYGFPDGGKTIFPCCPFFFYI